MLPHSLTNFEIQKYCQIGPKFNGVYLKIDLPKMQGGAYVINLYEYESIGTHWIVLYVKASNNVTYFYSFGVEHIPERK